LQAKAVKSGARVVRSIHQLNTMVVEGSATMRTSLSADSGALEVAADHVESIAPAERRKVNSAAPGLFGARTVAGSTANPAAAGGGVHADPAFNYKGLLWDYRRMGLPQAGRPPRAARRSPSA